MKKISSIANRLSLLIKKAQQSVTERILSGNIKSDTLPQEVKDLFEDDNLKIWDRFGVPIAKNFANRAKNFGGSKVYSPGEVGNIFAQAAKAPTFASLPLNNNATTEVADVHTAPKTEQKTDTAVKDEPKLVDPPLEVADAEPTAPAAQEKKPISKSLKSFGIGATAATLAWIGYELARNRKLNKLRKLKANLVLNSLRNGRKDLRKVAGAWDAVLGSAARTVNPEADLLDDMARAKTPGDYKSVNDKIRGRFDARIKDNTIPPYLKTPFGWPYAFLKPEEIVKPVPADDKSILAFNGAMSSMLPGAKRSLGIPYDPRQGVLDYIAASMIPLDPDRATYSKEPNIGNTGFFIPALMQQYANERGLDAYDKLSLYENGLDKVVLNAIKKFGADHPAVKNLLSAYVNGGFGRSSQPQTYGLSRPLWDYNAQATTPTGSNMLWKATQHLGRAGAYGGTSVTKLPPLSIPGMRPVAKNVREALGNMYSNEVLDRIFNNQGIRNIYSGLTEDQILDAANHTYQKNGVQTEALPLYARVKLNSDIPLEEKQNFLFNLHNDTMLETAISQLLSDKPDKFSWGTESIDPILKTIIEKKKDTYLDNLRPLVEEYNKKRKYGLENPEPYLGYSNEAQNKHYQELLRLFDELGPELFMPNTVLGGDMVFNPVGGLIPNGQKLYDTYMPYMSTNNLNNIDALTGNITRAKKDLGAIASGEK